MIILANFENNFGNNFENNFAYKQFKINKFGD